MARDGSLFTCDRCGEQARGFIPEGWIKFWPPARWIWGFGFESIGPHACSAACWKRVNDQHRAETGKFYIPDGHDRWGHVPSGMTEEPPPAPPFDPSEFNLRPLGPHKHRPDRPPPIQQVYFAQAGEDGPIKIGTSEQVDRRLKSLQLSCPQKLRLLGTVFGGHKLERELHRMFEAHRIQGEWFRAGPDLLEYIRQHASAAA